MTQEQKPPKHARVQAPLEPEFNKIVSPFQRFLNHQATTGFVLIIAAVLAMVLANSDWQCTYQHLVHSPIGMILGPWQFNASMLHFVNDGLMVLFFFLLGLEIKREVLVGELADLKQSALVIAMAIGGMVVPASVYLAITYPDPELMRGWGIPMATDTAFALGILAMLGTRAPRSAAIVMSALAILDDLGAVLVISLFYTQTLSEIYLLYGLAVLGLLFLANRTGVRSALVYVLLGLSLWYCILNSGVHATTAGILVALCVPTRPQVTPSWFATRMRAIVKRLPQAEDQKQQAFKDNESHELMAQAQFVAKRSTTPLQRWEHALERPIYLWLIPIFAFLNAGVAFGELPGELSEARVLFATAFGLVLGKCVGISIFAFAALKLNWAKLPSGMTPYHLVGVASLAGIGFTMSLFVTALAYSDNTALMVQAKLGILAGSLVAAVIGGGVFLLKSKPQQQETE